MLSLAATVVAADPTLFFVSVIIFSLQQCCRVTRV
jgi:hypothetical protein